MRCPQAAPRGGGYPSRRQPPFTAELHSRARRNVDQPLPWSALNVPVAGVSIYLAVTQRKQVQLPPLMGLRRQRR